MPQVNIKRQKLSANVTFVFRACLSPFSNLARNAGVFMVFMFFLLSSCPITSAVRANCGVRQIGPRLEEMGKHEEAAFYYHAGLDFYASILQLWIGEIYDERGDEIYRQYAEVFHSRAADANVEVSQLVKALSGDNALAEWKASKKLAELGDVAVPPLAELAGSQEPLVPRSLAVEILGKIGTKAAMDALLKLLKVENNLAMRGQICMRLGYAREKRALPIIAEWLRTIGPRALNDVHGPKEVQPSTCYIRHVEALGMIGDESAIPILAEFKQNIPPNIGYGGFVTNFVTGSVNQALADIRDNAAFWQSVEKHPGLAERIAPLFRYFHTNNVAKFRHYESEVVRGTKPGKGILQSLTKQADSKLAMAATTLLDRYDDLERNEGGEAR